MKTQTNVEAMDMMRLHLDVRLVDEYGRTHAAINRELSEKAAFMGDRIVPEMRFGALKFDDVVDVMRVREFRRGLLIEAARMAGMQIADFLEDREGWHGADRQESTEAALTQR